MGEGSLHGGRSGLGKTLYITDSETGTIVRAEVARERAGPVAQPGFPVAAPAAWRVRAVRSAREVVPGLVGGGAVIEKRPPAAQARGLRRITLFVPESDAAPHSARPG